MHVEQRVDQQRLVPIDDQAGIRPAPAAIRRADGRGRDQKAYEIGDVDSWLLPKHDKWKLIGKHAEETTIKNLFDARSPYDPNVYSAFHYNRLIGIINAHFRQ